MQTILLMTLLLQAENVSELDTPLSQARPENPKTVRLAAMKKLSSAAQNDLERVCAVVSEYADEQDADIRESAILVLMCGWDRIPCPLVIVTRLFDDDPDVRRMAVTAMIYRTYPPEAIPLLFKAVQSTDPKVRSAAVSALVVAAGKRPDVLEALRHAMRDVDILVRVNAESAYFSLTDDLRIRITFRLQEEVRLSQLLKSEEKLPDEVIQRAKLVLYINAMLFHDLNRERPDDVAKVLVALLTHQDGSLRNGALFQLRAMCEVSKTSHWAVADLKPEKLLNQLVLDEPSPVATNAQWVLSLLKQGPPKGAPEVLSPLEGWSREPVIAPRP